jgi:hypothetical protein
MICGSAAAGSGGDGEDRSKVCSFHSNLTILRVPPVITKRLELSTVLQYISTKNYQSNTTAFYWQHVSALN